MSEHIEGRIIRLETRVASQKVDMVLHDYYIKDLKERVKALEDEVEDLKEQTNILADDYKIFRSEGYTDQSTEEFVRVVRCENCVHWRKDDGLPFQHRCDNLNCHMSQKENSFIFLTSGDFFCKEGEKR